MIRAEQVEQFRIETPVARERQLWQQLMDRLHRIILTVGRRVSQDVQSNDLRLVDTCWRRLSLSRLPHGQQLIAIVSHCGVGTYCVEHNSWIFDDVKFLDLFEAS